MSDGILPVFEHEFWMRRCLALAERGWGKVSPNPMVGAGLVGDGEVLAVGWVVGGGASWLYGSMFVACGAGMGEGESQSDGWGGVGEGRGVIGGGVA